LSAAEIERRLGPLVDGRYRGVDVLERGDSPRILRAEVVGTGGRRSATGAELKAHLGLRDSWAYFGRIDTAAAGAAIATRSPASGSAPAGVLTGRVAPAPPGGVISVERRARRGWRVEVRARTDPSGAFRVAVQRAGRYRLRAQGAAGPAVRVGDGAERRAR
jgi:stage II sporulation protein D